MSFVIVCTVCPQYVLLYIRAPPPPFVLSGHGSSFSWLFYFVPRCLLSDIHRWSFFSRRLFSFSFFEPPQPLLFFGILLSAFFIPLCVERRFLCLVLTDCLSSYWPFPLAACFAVVCGWRLERGTTLRAKKQFFSLSAENGINLDVARTSWKLESPRVCQRTMTCRWSWRWIMWCEM